MSAVLLALTLGAGCVSLPALRRGAGKAPIHGQLARVMETDAYACQENPDRTVLVCTHATKTNMNFAYLAASNLLQVFSTFDRRSDEGMAAKWRGECADVATELNALNDGQVLQVSCNDNVAFALSLWVPDNGFTDADVLGLAEVFRTVLGEALRKGRLIAE